jgi:hypothetical protein
MAKSEFVLEIKIERGQGKDSISNILGIQPNWKSKDWCYAVIVDYDDESNILDEDEYEDFDDIPSFIDEFIDLLDGKFEQLAEIDIKRSDIIFWRYYAYNSQCNMEFTPKELRKLGDNEIRLCITCWDVYEPEEDT